MDTRRLILFVIFSFSIVMLWEAWQKQQIALHAPPVAQSAPNAAPGPASVPQPGSPAGVPAPTAPNAAPNAVPVPAGTAVPAAATPAPTAAEAVVKTDMVTARINSVGGSIDYLSLVHHKDSDDQTRDFVLFGTHGYAAQSGLVGSPALPTHLTPFTLAPGDYELKPGQNQVQVRLEANAGGVKVAKIYTFHRGSYVIDLDYQITNGSGAPLSPSAYLQLTHDAKPLPGDTRFMHTFTGPAFYTDRDKFKKDDFSDIEKGKPLKLEPADDGWVALVQHYFTSAWLPQGTVKREFYTRKVAEDLYSAGVFLPVGTIAPGATGKLDAKLFAGPQEVDALEAAAPHLERVKDYGMLDIIARLMYQALVWLHGYIGNWGLSIIALTIIIKAIFFPLSAASYKSMARMKKVTPKMTALREKYANDRAKMNQAMMELYKTEKINPLGGCLPVVIQIPVFISLYYALLSTVELRHAPFYGWITDLSKPDTLFGILPVLGGLPVGLLPILMAASMFLQTRMNPAPPDPVQARMMMFMPLVFSALFFFFPSGLVLYYVVNNLLSIAQQYSISRVMAEKEPGSGKPKAANDAKKK
ncbi:MAG TPA: membrane protein insertase YidC [Burkholderiales bacterium]|jgi:YidC/Oxa1 family membrane protein insertase